MNLSQRQIKLVNYLYTCSETYKDVESISSMLGVSKRTIFNDIKKLEEFGYSFDKKQGYGIKLINYEERKSGFLDSVEIRRKEIIKKLLFNDEILTYEKLLEEYSVSVSSIQNDFDYLKDKIISKLKVTLISNVDGTQLTGDENQWCESYIIFNHIIFNEELLNFHNEKRVIDVLSFYYSKNIVEKCYHIIYSITESNVISTSDYYFLNLLSVLISFCARLEKGHHQKASKKLLDSDRTMSMMNYLIAKDLLEMISEAMNLKYEEDDVYFLLEYIFLNKINFTATKVNYGNNYEKIIRKIISNMGKCTNSKLNDDEELYNNICLHIVPMIYRLKNDVLLVNPMIDEIKKQYKVMFDLTWICMESLQDKLNIKLTDDEVGFIMLHFQNSLEKNKRIKKLLIVCPNGISTSQILCNQIKNILPPLDVVEVNSINVTEQVDLSSIDMVISTVKLDNINKPIVVVPNILTSDSLEQIDRVYKNNFVFNKSKVEIYENAINDYIILNNILICDNATNKEEIIKMMCDSLIKENKVSNEFYESVIHREKISGTDMIFGSAIPHGQTKYVNETAISICVLKKPILWSKYKVSVVVLLALSQSDIQKSKKILDSIFSKINSKESVDSLVNLKTKEDIIKELTSGEKYDK